MEERLDENVHKCGYQGIIPRSGISGNVKLIGFQTSIGQTKVKSVKVEDFESNAIDVKSAYNGPTIKCLMTRTPGGWALISNVQFGAKVVQFKCVDGCQLGGHFQHPFFVVSSVNKGNLAPVVIKDLENISFEEQTKVDAYAGSIWYCLFLYEVFGRVGIIDDSHVYLSVVNVDMANAFWNGFFMTYGNGKENGRQTSMKPLTSLDVVGHESGHGIIEALGGLVYQGESGALNESIADIFGTCLEKYYDLRSKTALFDWNIGEDVMKGGGLRSLSNPHDHRQPDHYGGKFWIEPNSKFDNGGVHINSGVNNYLFYLLCHGEKGEKGEKQTFELFVLAKFIYSCLGGLNGCTKITSSDNYHQYAQCLVVNIDQYLQENKLDLELAETLKTGLKSVGLT